MNKRLNWLQRYVRKADPMEAFMATFLVVWTAVMVVAGVWLWVT